MQIKDKKKTLLIDLDGVLNKYQGNFDENFIPEPQEGVHKFLENLSKKYKLILFTTRNRLLASKWLLDNNLDKYFSDITKVKELSWLMIDDRCIKFNGDYKDITQQIENFKPWFKEELS